MPSAVSVREAVQIIEEAEEKLKQAREVLEAVAQQPGTEAWPGGRILAEILAEGGAVTRDRLYELAAKHGMDRRGLGGFFRASGRGSLYEIPGMNRIVLTPAGIDIARRVLEKEDRLTYQVQDAAFTRVAERSFAEDWESDEDSVYDRL